MRFSVPEDTALIGFGDFDSALIIDPPVTGKTAFDFLLKKISELDYYNHLKLSISLVIRNSCGCL